MKKFTELKSVGCVIDEQGIVYPQLKNGEIDYNNMTYILDIDNDEDWFKRLDTNDRNIVDTFVKEQTEFWGDKDDK